MIYEVSVKANNRNFGGFFGGVELGKRPIEVKR